MKEIRKSPFYNKTGFGNCTMSFFRKRGDIPDLLHVNVCTSMDAVLTSICERLNNIHFPTTAENMLCKKQMWSFFSKWQDLVAVDGN